ncbi:hypothetical protein [Methylicorpusculum sp.]|uniref:hypothetical protein n=1 Tax=Methylicorpusculum sp. TaxID=2713644 RepID=UPI00273199DD|nr:hypothetical protein [Methylicorpusculum sp.]MDP2177094.1 hypothetical protein [Methylicorpusculum sp.]MDP3529325.1 hypothetical protein [Methylicorpusculum sp.]MDZ4152156.1 hypothetical protein [Methylicorpusculum sp.]
MDPISAFAKNAGALDVRRHIIPSSQNRQIINVTNYTQNITLINNTIVNQGVPVKQIEQITRQPVIPVVPKVHKRMDITSAGHDQAQPNIIQLPMAGPTPDEIRQNEELARRLDGKKPEGTRTGASLTDFGQPRTQESRVPGRLTGAAPTQAPNPSQETQNPAMIVPGGETFPQPALPETPPVGLSLDSEEQHKRHEAGSHQEAQIPVEPSAQLPSANIPLIIPVQPQTDSVSAPEPATTQQTVSTDAATMPSIQNQLQPVESAKQLDVQTLQAPSVDQPQIERQQTENLQRQHEEATLQQELQNQQLMEAQRQQAERDRENAQQLQQQEAARQQELQNQQLIEGQRQQAERNRENAQQLQQQEAARQQELQNQQLIEAQRQQAERDRENAQQIQQQEAARQQELQNQQLIEEQRQQAERNRESAQQIQQQEAARQQELQNQQQMEAQRQQAERAKKEAEQKSKSEANLEPPH